MHETALDKQIQTHLQQYNISLLPKKMFLLTNKFKPTLEMHEIPGEVDSSDGKITIQSHRTLPSPRAGDWALYPSHFVSERTT